MADKDTTQADKPFGAFRRKAPERAPVAAVPQDVPADLVEIGSVGDAYGIRGWIKLFAHAGPGRGSDTLLSAQTWWLEDRGGVKRAHRVAQAKLHSGTVVAQLDGIADRDEALALRGQRVHVPRAAFPKLATDEFYWVDLQGLDAFDTQGRALGVVADLIDNGAHSVLRIEFERAGTVCGERMIPFVEAYVQSVDLAAKRIVLDWDPAWDLEGAQAEQDDASASTDADE
jgi:16S rRNA processing protein RimM